MKMFNFTHLQVMEFRVSPGSGELPSCQCFLPLWLLSTFSKTAKINFNFFLPRFSQSSNSFLLQPPVLATLKIFFHIWNGKRSFWSFGVKQSWIQNLVRTTFLLHALSRQGRIIATLKVYLWGWGGGEAWRLGGRVS